MPEVETKDDYPQNFEELWDYVGQSGKDMKQWAEQVYIFGTRAKIERELIEGLIGLAQEMKGLDDYLTENKAEISDLNALRELLEKHKHSPSGEAMQPIQK